MLCLQVTDKYSNEVTQLARPLPVEYLLVDMPAAFPVDLAFTFHADPNIRPFAVANRSDIGELQVQCWLDTDSILLQVTTNTAVCVSRQSKLPSFGRNFVKNCPIFELFCCHAWQ